MTASQQIQNVLEGRELTALDLVAITGRSHAAIVTGLYQLRRMGILKTTTFRMTSDRGRPRAIYSLESAA